MREMVLDRENAKILDLFQHLEGFQLFSDQELLSFVEMGRIREYEPGETVIKQGEFDCWVYILITGTLDIVKSGQIVSSLRRCGDMFGEMGVIDGSPRSATIKASTKAVVLGFDASVIDNKLKTNHLGFCYTIYRIFSEVLAVRLRETTQENMRLKRILAPLQQHDPASKKAGALPLGVDPQNVKVLLVDDDQNTRKMLRSILRELRFQEIIEAGDAKQALRILNSERIDLVLAELDLAGTSCLELLEMVRSLPTIKDVPFIILTSGADKDQIQQAAEAKVTHYLVKPITTKTLFDKIKESLEANL